MQGMGKTLISWVYPHGTGVPTTHRAWINLDTSPKSELTLELMSRAAPSVEAHHRSVGPDAGRNSGGRRIKKVVFCFRTNQLAFKITQFVDHHITLQQPVVSNLCQKKVRKHCVVSEL